MQTSATSPSRPGHRRHLTKPARPATRAVLSALANDAPSHHPNRAACLRSTGRDVRERWVTLYCGYQPASIG